MLFRSWTDVFWTWGTGLTLAAAALFPWYDLVYRQVMIAAFMAIWALRLGLYLTPRVITHAEDPRYGYDRHKGYATAEHLAALSRFGYSPLHRRSFRPPSLFDTIADDQPQA